MKSNHQSLTSVVIKCITGEFRDKSWTVLDLIEYIANRHDFPRPTIGSIISKVYSDRKTVHVESIGTLTRMRVRSSLKGYPYIYGLKEDLIGSYSPIDSDLEFMKGLLRTGFRLIEKYELKNRELDKTKKELEELKLRYKWSIILNTKKTWKIAGRY